MPLRLALVCCTNGFGHVKALAKVIVHLADRLPLHSVSLFCEEYQLKQTARWSEFCRVSDRVQTEIIPVILPLRWRFNQKYYGEWLLDWHHEMAAWGLNDFDHVVS